MYDISVILLCYIASYICTVYIVIYYLYRSCDSKPEIYVGSNFYKEAQSLILSKEALFRSGPIGLIVQNRYDKIWRKFDIQVCNLWHYCMSFFFIINLQCFPLLNLKFVKKSDILRNGGGGGFIVKKWHGLQTYF